MKSRQADCIYRIYPVFFRETANKSRFRMKTKQVLLRHAADGTKDFNSKDKLTPFKQTPVFFQAKKVFLHI